MGTTRGLIIDEFILRIFKLAILSNANKMKEKHGNT